MARKNRCVVAAFGPIAAVALLAMVGPGTGRSLGQEKEAPKEAGKENSEAKIRSLKKDKVALLREVTSILKVAYMSGSTSIDRVQAAQKSQLAAELDLCETDKERLAILKDMYALAREAEAAADQRFKRGDVPKNEALMATVGRIEAEIALEKARAKMEKGDNK